MYAPIDPSTWLEVRQQYFITHIVLGLILYSNSLKYPGNFSFHLTLNCSGGFFYNSDDQFQDANDVHWKLYTRAPDSGIHCWGPPEFP